jgi:hypothetical protein
VKSRRRVNSTVVPLPLVQLRFSAKEIQIMKTLRLVLLLVSIFALGFASIASFGKANSVGGQDKQELCRDNQARLDELGKQAETLESELAYTSESEDKARLWLSNLNKAIVDPQRRQPGKLVNIYANTPAEKQMLARAFGVTWKEAYVDDDVRFLQAVRDGAIRRVERIKYVLAHKSEITQQKANVDRQIDFHRNRLTELRCESSSSSAGCDALTGTWTWSWGNGKVKKGEEETTIVSDHTMNQPGNAGTWTCSGGSVTFNWKHSKDTLTIVDKDTLSGGSNFGDWVKATRK